MDKLPPPKINWVATAKFIFPFYLLATVSDILIHQPPYQMAENNADLTYQFFGLILGWLPLLILAALGPERARQLLPASVGRSLLNSLGLLVLFTSTGMKNAFMLALLLFPSDVLSTSALLIPLQAIIVIVKWTGFGLFVFPAKCIKPSGSSRAEKLRSVILVILILLLVALSLVNLIGDIKGLVNTHTL